MGIHKKVKFPIEITQGKADDLYRLRFMRKSELEPNLRHSLRYNACQMGRQLDLWYKEQSFTIGSLSKEQEKLYKSSIRLRQEVRRSKRKQHARFQEEIRTKLHSIKIKMVVMKVVQKFRNNVRINKALRGEIVRGDTPSNGAVVTGVTPPPKGNVDILRISGNKQFIHGNCEDDAKEQTDDAHEAVVDHCEQPEGAYGRQKVRGKLHKGNARPKPTPHGVELLNNESDYLNTLKFENVDNQVMRWVTNNDSNANATDEDDSNIDVDDVDDNYDEDDGVIQAVTQETGQRYPSSHGPRMETIPEESFTEVAIEINDTKGPVSSVLTQRRLHLLNRSNSKRNVFDIDERVPLLPEVTGAHVPPMTIRPLPDTLDKETQTSDKSSIKSRKKDSYLRKKRRSKHRSPSSPDQTRKKIVVKLPGSASRVNSAKSNGGHFGSESDEENGSDTDLAYGYSESLASDSSSYYSSETDDEIEVEGQNKPRHTEEYSLTLTKHKSTLRRKSENTADSRTHVQSLPTITNISADLPSVTYFHVQNPFSLKYKERSFFIKSSVKERPTSSAREDKRRSAFFEQGVSYLPSTSPSRGFTDTVQDTRGRKDADLRPGHVEVKESLQETRPSHSPRETTVTMTTAGHMADIAVFGRKPDGIARADFPTPPNTPIKRAQSGSPRKTPRSHLTQILLAQKRAKLAEQERIHEIVTSEPVQKYERTSNGKLKPFGSPRLTCRETPSMKDKYYRDKLLRQERASILKQTVQMKRFIDTFDREHDSPKFPPVAECPTLKSTADSVNNPRKTLGGLLFKVYEPEQTSRQQKRKVVPGVSTTSLRLLKNCRYLREYKPIEYMSPEEKMTSLTKKVSSWSMRDTSAYEDYHDNYIANIRIHLI